MALHHHHHVAHMARAEEIQTVVSIVYVTASKTFDGEIGGYITLKPGQDISSTTVSTDPTTVAALPNAVGTPLQHSRTTVGTTIFVHPTHTSSSSSSSIKVNTVPIRSQRPGSKVQSSIVFDSSSLSSTSSSVEAISSTSSIIEAVSTSTSKSIQPTTFISSTTSFSSSSSASLAVSSTAVATSAIASLSNASATVIKTHSDDMSSGAKAGIAIAVLLAIGLISALAFIFYRRKKDQRDSSDDTIDEKPNQRLTHDSPTSSFRQSYLRAPRLSLGPLNHIFPGMSEKPVVPRSNSTDSNNPFGDHAETIVEEKNHPMLPQVGFSAAAAVPKPLSIKSNRSGAGTNSPLPSPARSSPTSPGPSNVHRVQLDFKPSMDDELELRTGQIVRMLHEYDDGWALCIRLDRSQQGVVPRTCISKLPLKPRPAGPPQGRIGHHASPGGSLSSTTTFTSDEAPRPLSPSNGRLRSQTGPHSNAQYGDAGSENRPRANSAGTSPLNPMSAGPMRKPVPGQAL